MVSIVEVLRPLSAADLLHVWERGQAQQPFQRALLLLSAAVPGVALADLARLSIGQRDSCLVTLREWAFGARLACVARCPACGERLELEVDTSAIRVPPRDSSEGPPELLTLSAEGYEVQFRAPNSLDLAAADGADLPRRVLLERCITSAFQNGGPISPAALPDTLANQVIRLMAECDPGADIQFALICPACGHGWSAQFDIAAYFWEEIEAWARRALREVHTLALAYGWSEAEILALSPRRRRIYLEMVSA